MLIQDWQYQLLRTIPEAIAIVALGTALIGEKYSFKQITLAGLIMGATGFILQQAPIKYGVHIPLGIIVTMLTLNILFKLKIVKSAAAALLSFIVLVFAEWIIVIVQTRLLGYTEEQILGGTDLSRFLYSLPPLVLFIALAVIAQSILRFRIRRAEDKS